MEMEPVGFSSWGRRDEQANDYTGAALTPN